MTASVRRPGGEGAGAGMALPFNQVAKAISRKRCKIGGKLLLITNRKSHMSFRSVPKSVTLNDTERHNSPNYSPN